MEKNSQKNLSIKRKCLRISGLSLQNGICSLLSKRQVNTEFTRGPGRGDTCHLSYLDETLPD